MEESDFNECWKKALENWDGSSQNTFNFNEWDLPQEKLSNQILVTNQNNEDDNIKTLTNFESGELQLQTNIDYEQIEEVPVTKDSAPKENLVLIEELARGGMGVIFRAYQSNLGREVVVKKTIEDNPIIQDRFLSEAKINAYLDHPNIVPVHDLGVNEKDELVLVMKLVQGVSWKETIALNSLDKNLEILLTVMNAVAFSHNKGIAHNDLKPDNVMIGKFGEVFLMDWGIAVNILDSLNNIHFPHKSSIISPIGTPGYMAPELAKGKGQEISARTDVYLLGSILYEILMGFCPHRGKNFMKIISSVMQFVPLAWNDDVSEDLKNICLKAMSLKPEDRFESVIEFRQEIENYLQHRESLIISQNAQNILQSCKEKTQQNILETKNKPENLYDDITLAISGFCQSLELWNGNKKAEQGKREARLQYIRFAIQNGDFGLAQFQLQKLSPDDSEIITFQKNITQAKKLSEYGMTSKKLVNIAQMIIFVLCFRQITVLFGSGFSQDAFFTQNNTKTFIITMGLAILSLVAWRVFSRKNFNVKMFLTYAIFYEIVNVFLLSFWVISVDFDSRAVTTGMYAQTFMMLLFRIIIPYKRKTAFIIGLISASVAIINLFFASWLFGYNHPKAIVEPYIGQSILALIAGTIISWKNK